MTTTFATRLRHEMAECLLAAKQTKTRKEAQAVMRDWEVLNDLYNLETVNHLEFH